MPEYTQDKRPIAIETPLGKDVLLLDSFTGSERMSGLFRFELDLLSEKDNLKPKDLLGKRVSFRVNRQNEQPRWFNGFVKRFGFRGKSDRLSTYAAEVVPWFWFLTRSTDCRIFQKKSVVEIVEKVFSDHGFAGDFDKSKAGSYPKRDYCVQYRESDYDFVSRLLEEEGIYYYFKHEQGKHTLVLGDSPSGYFDCEDGTVQSISHWTSGGEEVGDLGAWEHSYDFRSGKIAQTSFDFKKPSTDLATDKKTKISLERNDKCELYDYADDYCDKGEGDKLARIRMEEEEAQHEEASGSSDRRTFSPGGKFQLKKHTATAEEGGKYVLTQTDHFADTGGAYVASASPSAKQIYENSFTCIRDNVAFRPPRLTPRPQIHSIQTAVVTGPKGEEIYTDKYGRVKVQLHWDREGKKDENTTCWMRVATPWSGVNWGAIFIPRIGQEVVVSFVEGNPDRPIITSMLYNDETMPPYALDEHKTQTGIKTRSTPEGGSDNFNELRFEDKKGEEEVYMHAEKNFNCVVENNETRKVGFDKKGKGDQTVEVFNNQTFDVGVDGCEEGNQTSYIWNNQDNRIGYDGCKEGSQFTKIWNDQEFVIGNGEGQAANGDQNVYIWNNQYVEIGRGKGANAAGDQEVHIWRDRKTNIQTGNDILEIDKGDREVGILMGNETTKLDLGKSSTEALQGIELKCGQSSIKIDQTGITIKGLKIQVEGKVMTQVKGLVTQVSADAMLTVKGGIMMLG